MAQLTAVVTQDLSKGTNLVTNPYLVGKQQSILITNMLLDEHGSLRTRDGTLILTTSPDVAPNVRPIVKLYNLVLQNGLTQELAIVQGTTGNNQLYDRGTTPWTLLGTLSTQYATPDILTFTNLALIANGYETPYSFDGASLLHLVDTPGTGVVPIGAAHHTLHQGFYWVWNTAAVSQGSGVSVPTTLYAGPSALQSSDLNNPNSWPKANQVFVDKDDGDSGQGLGQFTIAESGISPTTSQILFKQFKAFQMTGVFGSTTPAFAIQKIKSDMGCVAPRTIQFAPGFGLIRMTHRGFALFDGVADSMISEEVRPLIFGTTVFEPVDWARITTGYAVVVPNPPCYVAFLPVCGGTGLSRVFVYDLVRKSWTVLQFPMAIGCAQVVTTPSVLPVLDTTGFGRLWTLEPDDRINLIQPTASVYINDLTVYSFHAGGAQPLVYDVSTDGGVTWPTQNATAKTATNDVLTARTTRLANGTLRVLLLQNDSKAILYSDTVLTLPTTSTWTELVPSGSVGAPNGLEVSGLNAVVGLQDGGGNLKYAYSLDGGATWLPATTGVTDTVETPFGYQKFASPSALWWFHLNPKSGKIYQSTDGGNNWTGPVKTITAGDASLPAIGAILAVSATRVVACYKGQVSTADLAAGVWTWTDQQNLTVGNPLDVQQGAVGFFANFGLLSGSTVLGAATIYADQFGASTTAGAMWRSTDLGTTWSLINAVGGGKVSIFSSTALTAFAARNGRGVIDLWNVSTTHRNTWTNTIPRGGTEGTSAACPPALAQILLGDYDQGNVRQTFGGDTTDDGQLVIWQAALHPVSSPSPQANGYFRRTVIKVANVTAGQVVNLYAIVGPTVSSLPSTVSKTLTAPVAVGLGFYGYGLGPYGSSPYGGVTENSEVDLTADIGLIGTNMRPILSGGGPIIIRGIEHHVRAKPLRRVSVYT